MKHPIDPTVDCVFKAILGAEAHKNLLVNFLNAVSGLRGHKKIKGVTILNPYNDQDYLDGKLSIVDVKAEDTRGDLFQIEIQTTTPPALPQRMLYTWATMYHLSLGEGDIYSQLKPLISIWILRGALFPKTAPHLTFQIYDPEHDLVLSRHCCIHVLQLKAWPEHAKIDNDKARWMTFFKNGKKLEPGKLPKDMDTREMRQAMGVLKTFSEKDENYFRYLSRFFAEKDRLTIEKTMAAQKRDLERADRKIKRMELEKRRDEREKDRAKQDKLRAEQEKERLLNILKKSGIDPNANS